MLNTNRDQNLMRKSRVKLNSFKSVTGELAVEKRYVSVTYLNDHFKGEHSSEDIIKITEDLHIL